MTKKERELTDKWRLMFADTVFNNVETELSKAIAQDPENEKFYNKCYNNVVEEVEKAGCKANLAGDYLFREMGKFFNETSHKNPVQTPEEKKLTDKWRRLYHKTADKEGFQAGIIQLRRTLGESLEQDPKNSRMYQKCYDDLFAEIAKNSVV